jgi:hypothetical protein
LIFPFHQCFLSTMTDAAVAIEALGENIPLLEGIRTTRAIRRLKPDPVPRALIRKVCEAGTFAPSGGNRQPWFGREIDAWLGLPENCPTCAMLPIGWPRGGFARPERRSVDACLFWERFEAQAK